MNKKRLRELSIKSITGNINDTEKKLLNDWLNESELDRREFEKLGSIWKSTLPDNLPELPALDSEWMKLNEMIKSSEKKNNIAGATVEKIFEFIQFNFLPKLRPVVSAAILLFFIVSGILLLNLKVPSVEIKIISTARNERINVSLPDGSLINLNANSTIEYPESFSKKNRDVNLKGEAFFSVARDALHPFVIRTANATVTVLGTKFDVCSRGKLTKVFVKEGKVNLANDKSDPKSVKLTSGQMGLIIKDEAPVTENAGFNYLPGWINGKLEFNRTRISAVLKEVERFYNVKIKIEDAGLNNLTLTGTFENTNVDSVLTMICLAADLKYEKQNDLYLIKLKK